MGRRRGIFSSAATIGALVLTLPNRIEGQLPAPEQVANALLSTSGILSKLQQVNIASADSAAASGTNSAIWSAFLSAAAENAQGGSIGDIANAFTTLQDGDVTGIFNSAVPGQEKDPSSIFTADLGTDSNIDLTNGQALFNIVFGNTGNNAEDIASNIQNPAWWGKTLYKVIMGGGSSSSGVKTDCAWTATISWDKSNISFPDQNSVYHLMYFEKFGPSDVVMIEGEFPDSRYFSVQSYDETFSPITSLRDLEVVPYTGVNPFAKKTPSNVAAGKYKIFLTKDGKMGFPNEVALSSGNYSTTSLGMFIFRMYGIDPLADTKDPTLKYWGYKAPPTMAVRTAGGITPTGWDATFKQLDACPDANTDAVSQAVKTLVEGRPSEDSVKDTRFQPGGDAVTCRVENLKDGFMLMSRAQSSQSRAPFINADANYLMACANGRAEYLKSNDLIGVVRNNFPSTPYSKFQSRYVGDAANYDVRYASLSVYDLKSPAPVYRTIGDADFRDFYYNLYGAETWETQYGRNVSLIVTNAQAALDRCKVDTSESFTVALDAGGQVAPEWWGVIYRELVPQSSVITPDKAILYGMNPADIYSNSVLDAARVMCPKNGSGCDSNPYRTASIMQTHFPRIDWYTCSPAGVLAPAVPSTKVAYDTAFASKQQTARTDQYFYKYCPNNVNSGLLEVYAPTTVTLHSYNQPTKTAPANTLGTAGLNVTTNDAALVVGVSVKAYDGQDAYFKAQATLCGYTYVSNPKWKCLSHPPPDDQWLTPEYDDSAWENAVMIEDDYVVAQFDPVAKWITNSAPSVGTYCRLVIPNPTYLF